MKPIPFPSLFKIRADFPLEIGFVDAVREPMPQEYYEMMMAKWGHRVPEPLRPYSVYLKNRALYRAPKYVGYMAVIKPGDDQFSMIVTDGHHIFYADYPGLYEAMIGKLAEVMKVDDVLKLSIFPKGPGSKTEITYPKQFIVHETTTGDAALIPWAERKLYIGSPVPTITMSPPDEEGEEWKKG